MESEKLYMVYCQRECEDPFYIPYHDVWRVFHSKEKAIQAAINLKNNSNDKTIYYIKEYTYDDDNVYFNHEIKDRIDENKVVYPNEANKLSDFNIVYLLGDINKVGGLMKIKFT